jgi:asparagine synthase (glutamine-hydrolysing)
MCGITGIVQLDGQNASLELLQKLTKCISHRGPDDEGFKQLGAAALGHRRLSIIDLSGGAQPLCNEDETVWIAFNGEIYNFPELRAELEDKGHRFRTHSDTEAIVHAYEEWGELCPQKLRGMFAFAIYDLKTQALFLARDRLGKKPLLYARTSNSFVFASEFQSLLAHPDVSREINFAALDLYLSNLCVPAPYSIYENIHKLPPAHTLTLQNGEIKLRRYWSLDEHFSPSRKLIISEAEAIEELQRRLEECVRIRLMSEVPLGAFLSGGIDSSAVVAMMARLSDRPVKTFSIGFEESDYSETPHARRLAERYGCNHHEIIVRSDAQAILPTLVRHYGEPYADSSAVPSFYVAQETSKHVTVALNGDGGDETFAGYERYRGLQLTESFPAPARVLGAIAGKMLPGGLNFRSRAVRAKKMLQAMALPAPRRYLHWQSAFNEEQKAALYNPSFAVMVQGYEDQSQRANRWAPEVVAHNPVETYLAQALQRGYNIVDACQYSDINAYLPDDLLVKVDITTMANSLEARSPLLDHTLMEWAATLPQNLKLNGSTGKYILRRAIADLVPPENMERPKMGFGVPVGKWLRGEMKPLFCDTVLSERALNRGYFRPDALRALAQEHFDGRAEHGPRLWTLLMLELWHQEFLNEG